MTTSLWTDDADATPRPPLEGAVSCEIAVVGGGITGAAAAFHLARRGARVVLLERDRIGSGSTACSLGIAGSPTPYTYALAAKLLGPDRTRELWRLARLNLELILESGLPCGLERCGSLELASSEPAAALLRDSARLLVRDGFPAELRESPGFSQALFQPGHVAFNPVMLARGLAGMAERRGARVHEGTGAILERMDPPTFRTPRGTLSAHMALLTCGADIGRLCEPCEDMVIARRMEIAATVPCPDRILEAPATFGAGFDAVRQLADGRILATAGRPAVPDGPERPPGGAIEEFLHRRWPRTRTLALSHRANGLLDLSCDEIPDIGAVPGAVGLFLATGFHGRGLALALAAARMAAELMIDGRSSLWSPSFSPRRHSL